MAKVPKPLQKLLHEVYRAQANDQRWLAAIGLRGIVEVIANDLVGDLGSYADKLETLKAKGFISNAEFPAWSAVIAVGNASAHRGYSPKSSDLATLFDVVEHFLRGQYVVGPGAKKAKRNAPKRPPRLKA
jgi:hypothetical protein